VYPNAKYEAIGNPYINKQSLEKLMEFKTLDNFIDQINMSKDYHIEGTTASEVQQSLDDHYLSMVSQMKNDHGKKMKEFFTTYIEFKHAWIVKEIIRSLHKKQPIDSERLLTQSRASRITQFIIDIKDASEELIPNIFRTFGFNPTLYDLVIDENTIPIQLDVQIDRYYIDLLESVKVPYKCSAAKHEYLCRLIDIQSMKNIIRAKHMEYHENLCRLFYLDDGYEILSWKFDELCKADNLKDLIEMLNGTSYYQKLKQALDKQDSITSAQPLITALDSEMLSLLRNISQQYYVSIGPSLRYLISKQSEITNLKIICKGIGEKISSDHILPLLVTEVPS
jgi:vacuolar-type H+-ATPase subunit C/Vma6